MRRLSIRTIIHGTFFAACCIFSGLAGTAYGYYWAATEYEEIIAELTNHLEEIESPLASPQP